MATPSSLIKLEVGLYKKDEVTHEDFVKWATEVYPPKANPVMKKYGVVKFTQTITPPHFREPFRKSLKEEMNRPNWTVPDYDIVHSYWLRSMEDMMALTASSEWAELEVEAQKISNISIGHFVAGHEIVQFQDNWVESGKADA